MTEENKKRINKLMIPFTKRTISFLAATTMIVTGTVGCKKEKEENKNKDTSSIISSVSDEEITSSDNKFTVDDNNSNTNNESSKSEQTTNNAVSNNATSNNKNNSTNTTSSNRNNQSNNSNSNSNQSGSNNTSKPSASTPTMPTKLTANNINDVEVFKHFSENIFVNSGANITYIGYWHNDEIYYAESDEYKFLLLLLNSEYINEKTYNELFANQSINDMHKMVNFVGGILNGLTKQGFNIYFDNIVIDNSKKEFLKLLQTSIKNKTVKQFVLDFANGNQKYYNYQDNIIMDYFVNSATNVGLSNEEFIETGWFNNYNDINTRMDNYLNNLYKKYNGQQYQKQ